MASLLTYKGIAVTAPAPRSYLNVAKERTGADGKKPPGSTHGYAVDIPADRSRSVTSLETEALNRPNALPKATNSQECIRSDCGCETGITSCVATGGTPAPDKVVARCVREGPPRQRPK